MLEEKKGSFSPTRSPRVSVAKQIIDLCESHETDTGSRGEAEAFADSVIRFLRSHIKNPIHVDGVEQYSADPFSIIMNTETLNIPGAPVEVSVQVDDSLGYSGGFSPYARGFYARSKAWPSIRIEMGDMDWVTMKSLIVHEYIHLLDSKRIGKYDRVMRSSNKTSKELNKDTSDPEKLRKYVEDPLESNAFYQMALSYLLTEIKEYAKKYGIEDLIKRWGLDTMDHFVQAFFDTAEDITPILSHVSSAQRKKIARRLVGTFEELRKTYGVTR